jgi:elongation factor P--(R)-beta-lysine ligase
MKEVSELVMELLRDPQGAGGGARLATGYLSYQEAFLRELALDPFEANLAELRTAAREAGFAEAQNCSNRDELLDVLMATRVGPGLGRGSLCFVHRYPASQAALAQIDPSDARCALRFELYCEGIELANGFKELASAEEQRARFERDLQLRGAHGLPSEPIDERLLAALASGLPDCAGVALGFDRLVMLATQAQDIDAVLPFPTERA